MKNTVTKRQIDELLYEQFLHMKGYLNALELRATIEKISLEKENKNEQSNCC